MPPRQIFLLSPANCSGKRAQLLVTEQSKFALAQRLRTPEGISLGEAFSFISGLYFRGKLSYAKAFERPPAGVPGSLVITAGRGLVSPDTTIRLADIQEFASVPIEPDNKRYREPLSDSLLDLHQQLTDEDRVVLLGSIATDKYCSILLEALGDQLVFPSEFIGRGDMSRGGLMLRCVDQVCELNYVAVAGATRHGSRPTRLSPRKKPSRD
jgi:hypothetical protein